MKVIAKCVANRKTPRTVIPILAVLFLSFLALIEGSNDIKLVN